VTPSLLVLAPRIGGVSETFVARHIDHLQPIDRTIVMARELVPRPSWLPGPEVRYLKARRLAPHGSRRWTVARRLARARRSAGPGRPAAGAQELLLELLDRNPDVAILAEYLDVWASLLSPPPGDGRVVVRAHGYDVGQRLMSPRWRDAYRTLAEHAVVAPVSEYSAALLIEAGLPPERVTVVSNGVDVEWFAPRGPDPNDDSPLQLLTVGRLVEKKDPRPTLRALSRLNQAGVAAHLTIIGEGPLRGAIEDEVRRLGLEPSVLMLGAVPHSEVRSRLARANVVVQHSQRAGDGDEEGLPMSVLEAMASALPVVATRHAGITEALSGGAGVLVDPGDTDSIADALRALADDARWRSAVGRAGRQRVEQQYSWAQEREGLLALLGIASG
jgi:glycosyltransferase involved in cell wall biosynthesis